MTITPSALKAKLGDDNTDVLIIRNLFYGYSQSQLSDQAREILVTLSEVLKTYPEIKLEIRSHTDSRGTHEFNKRLSAKRSAAVVGFLRVSGINLSRLKIFNFGEEILVNDCQDGSSCSDESHALNRRTEFYLVR